MTDIDATRKHVIEAAHAASLRPTTVQRDKGSIALELRHPQRDVIGARVSVTERDGALTVKLEPAANPHPRLVARLESFSRELGRLVPGNVCTIRVGF
jgi:hypothetical protein